MRKHTIDTASYDNYYLAFRAATKAGMKVIEEYRANCFKSYHLEIETTDPGQEDLLHLIANASFYAPGRDKLVKQLNDYIFA